MGQNLQTGVLIIGAVAAVALGRTIPALFAGGMPQVPGEDVLALVLGDARQELSGAMLDKVEEYYHGGVRGVDCEHGMGGEEEAHDQEQGGHAHEGEAASPAATGSWDLWSRIDRKVHEQVDRHLERDRAAELLPWAWAACRASPQNVQAFQVGAFVLSSMVKKPEEGVRLLEEGVRKNPGCAELDFSLGEIFLNSLHDAARAEPWFLSARSKCWPAAGPAGDAARVLKVKTLFYLGYLAKQRGELGRVETYATEAEEFAPEHVCTKNLRALLSKQK